MTRYATWLNATIVGLAVGIVAVPTQAYSGDADDIENAVIGQPAGGAQPWSLSFTTYGWLAWLKGDLSVRGRSLDVDTSPVDVINHLDWGGIPIWMSYAEARVGRLSLFNDIVYAQLEGSGDFATSAQGRFASLALGGNIKADYKTATVELGAAYEIWSNGTSVTTGRSALDVLAGGRYWYQDVDISADVTATLNVSGPLGIVDLTRTGNRVFARSGKVDWIDPFVGARLRHQLAPGQDFMLRGDIGGFGAGSDFSWHVITTYNHEFRTISGTAISAYIGYKALSVDYSEGFGNTRYEYDAIQHGPVTGLTMRF